MLVNRNLWETSFYMRFFVINQRVMTGEMVMHGNGQQGGIINGKSNDVFWSFEAHAVWDLTFLVFELQSGR